MIIYLISLLNDLSR